MHSSFGQARRHYLRYRRWLAALAAAGCVTVTVHELAPPPPETTGVVVAAHDLGPGQRLSRDDLRVVQLSPDLAPAGSAASVDQFTGERVAGPLRAGEIVTEGRVLGRDLIEQYGAGLAATPIRLPDADIVALLDSGDRVDVYAATGTPGRPADQVLSDVGVIAVPTNDERQGDGAVVVLALSGPETARLAQASATTQLSISMR